VDFVRQNDLALRVEPELVLRVGKDQPSLGREALAAREERQGVGGYLYSLRRAERRLYAQAA
jgi:hypothetical protein